jgi:hypothetical protein
MPHEEMHKELAECQASGEFVAYHSWGDDPGIFLVGMVEEITPTKVVFQEVDLSGPFEGPHAVPLRRIHSVDRGTHYLKRLRTLHDLGAADPVDEKNVTKSAEVLAILQNAAKEAYIVRIWTAAHEANDYFVTSVGVQTVALANVVDGDQRDGRSVVRLDRIVRVRAGAAEADDTRVHRHWQETIWNPAKSLF